VPPSATLSAVPQPPLRLLRLANPVVRTVLDSPAHRVLSGTLLVMAYRGLRSGRAFRIPLRYAEADGRRFIALAVQPDRKLWWRSFVEPTTATLVVRGAPRTVRGRLLAGAERRAALGAYLARYPRAAGALGVGDARSDVELDSVAAAVVAFDPPS
jgi:hypothetical protein